MTERGPTTRRRRVRGEWLEDRSLGGLLAAAPGMCRALVRRPGALTLFGPPLAWVGSRLLRLVVAPYLPPHGGVLFNLCHAASTFWVAIIFIFVAISWLMLFTHKAEEGRAPLTPVEEDADGLPPKPDFGDVEMIRLTIVPPKAQWEFRDALLPTGMMAVAAILGIALGNPDVRFFPQALAAGFIVLVMAGLFALTPTIATWRASLTLVSGWADWRAGWFLVDPEDFRRYWAVSDTVDTDGVPDLSQIHLLRSEAAEPVDIELVPLGALEEVVVDRRTSRIRKAGVVEVDVQATQRCPFCHDALAGVAPQELSTCKACMVVFHRECILEANSCTTWGCANNRRTHRANPA